MKTRRRAVQFNLPGKDETGSNTEKRELISTSLKTNFSLSKNKTGEKGDTQEIISITYLSGGGMKV